MQVTHSSMSTFRKCPRLYRYQYVDCRVKVQESAALALGTAWHRAMEGWWQPEAGKGRIESAINRIKDSNLDEQDVAKLCAMLDTYAPPSEKYSVEAIERTFAMPIINPDTGRAMKDIELCGKVDGLLVGIGSKELWVLEHKTTSEEVIGFGPYWQRLSIDHQIGIYVDNAAAVGALYDVTRKPTLKYCAKDKGDPLAYQQRCTEQRSDVHEWHQFREVRLVPEQIAEGRLDIWQTAHMLRECTTMGRYPRNSDQCRSMYGCCPYLDVCTGCARLDDDTIFRTKSAENEELF